MRVTIPAIEHENIIPDRFTCKGLNINPPLRIYEIPQNAKSLSVIMHDPDAPAGDFVHWVEYNIDPLLLIDEGSKPGTQGKNDFGKVGYGGPCPSSGVHRYVLEVYALDTILDLPGNRSRKEVEHAMQGHILATAEYVGRFGSE